MEARLRFRIVCWRAWLPPGLRSGPDVAGLGGWLSEPEPDVSFIPLMQRRRLSPMARAAVAAAWPCVVEDAQLPLVCCSLHGETYHCFPILNDLALGEDVSPSRFALSVHGAIGGLLGQFTADRAPCVAVAPGAEGYSAALLEAVGLLSSCADRAGEVLVLWYEQPLPSVYHFYAPDPPGVMALAVRLGPWRGMGGCLNIERSLERGSGSVQDPLLRMIEGFGASTDQWVVTEPTVSWQWQVENV